MNELLRQFSEQFKNQSGQILEEFSDFLRFPSISADPNYRESTLDCFNWLESYVKKMGFTTEQWNTEGLPILFANYGNSKEHPTVLFYHHYDVQPVDPLDLWKNDPFDPLHNEKDNQVYARGAQDNKGQCFYVLTALRHLLEMQPNLPLNIKLCIEGEEEIGSPGLARILTQKKELLAADYLFIVDVGLQKLNTPAVTLGLRGIVTFDLTVTGSRIDLHSGSHGGIAYNANHALIQLLSQLRDAEGKITVPGFYEGIIELSDGEKAQLAFNFNSREYEAVFGAKPNGGGRECSPLESNWLRPTLEINGIQGGYSGFGFKTVIPAKASAKISCRLVPGQDPMDVAQKIISHLKKLAPEGIVVEGTIHPGIGIAVRSSPQTAIVQLVAQAYREVCAQPCDFILEGASIPIVAQLSACTNAQTVLFGYGLPDDQIHAPNEHFGWDRFEKGYLTIPRILDLVCKAANTRSSC